MPSQRMNSGTQAIEGMARNACRLGSTRRRSHAEDPVAAPMIVAATVPMTKPAATRASVTDVWRARSPLLARSAKVARITDGGGAKRPLDQPRRTATSQATASAAGSRRPSAGRA